MSKSSAGRETKSVPCRADGAAAGFHSVRTPHCHPSTYSVLHHPAPCSLSEASHTCLVYSSSSWKAPEENHIKKRKTWRSSKSTSGSVCSQREKKKEKHAQRKKKLCPKMSISLSEVYPALTPTSYRRHTNVSGTKSTDTSEVPHPPSPGRIGLQRFMTTQSANLTLRKSLKCTQTVEMPQIKTSRVTYGKHYLTISTGRKTKAKS